MQPFDRAPEKRTDRQLTLLFIEDNPGDARLFREMLKEVSGDTCQIIFRDRLAAGLAFLSENVLDAVLLDLGLPDGQGLDTFLNLQKACPHIPIIVLTGLHDHELAVQAVSRGAQDYLVKGQVSGELLFRAICYAIERKRMDEERLKLEELLHRAEKMEALGTMAGGVAHDLNNVLGVLMGYSELLMEKLPEENTLRAYVENIFKSSEKSAAIIQDLLVLARRGVTVSEVVNLNRLVVNFMKSPVFDKLKLTHPRVIFSTDLAGDLLNIMGSSIHLEKTIMNLIFNAAEALPGAGEVTIRTENRYLDKVIQGYDQVQEGEYAVIKVSDNGSGITPADIRKIFEPFFTKKIMGRSGTGLGLPIVWGTVKDHNGYIDVQSEDGIGSTFTLYFPITREEIISRSQKIPLEQCQGHGETILVVDDVREQQEMAAMMLSRLGYEVQTVSGGEEAVEYLKRHQVDLLVLDMIMEPGIDGLETYRRALGINPKQKAILTSGFSETDRVKTAQALGAGAYVKKPYVLEKMAVAVREELLKVR